MVLFWPGVVLMFVMQALTLTQSPIQRVHTVADEEFKNNGQQFNKNQTHS